MPTDLLRRNANWSEVRGLRYVAGRVTETPTRGRAWPQGADISVHGLIYDSKDGALRDHDFSVPSGHINAGAAE